MIGSNKAHATVMITADPKGLEKAIARSKSALQKFGDSAGKTFGAGMKKAGSFIARSFDPIGKGMAIVGDAVSEVMDYERKVVRMAIAQGKTNEQMAGFRAQITAVSKATGVNRNEVLRGVSAYQSLSGDTAHAAAMSSTLARVSQATGTDIGDVAAVADTLRGSFGADPGNMEGWFDILIAQGKKGKIELNAVAGILPDLAGQFGQFAGGKTQAGMAEMNAGLQVMREKFGTAEKAATGFNALQSALISKAKKFEQAGIKVYDPKTGKLKEFSKIVTEIGAKTAKMSKTKLSGLFGSTEAYRAYLALNDNAALFTSLKDTSGSSGSTDKDLKQYKDSAAGKMESAINELKLAIVEALTPARIEKVAEGVSKVASAIGTISDGVGSFLDGAGDVGRGIAASLGFGYHKQGEGRDAATLTKRRYEQLAEIRGLDTSGSAEDIRWRLENLENGKGARINSAGGVQEQLQRARVKLAQETAAAGMLQSVGMGRSTADYDDVVAAGKVARHGNAYTEKHYRSALGASAAADLGEGGKHADGKGLLPHEAIMRIVQARAANGASLTASDIARAMVTAFKGVGLKVELSVDGNAVAKASGNAKKRGSRP